MYSTNSTRNYICDAVTQFHQGAQRSTVSTVASEAKPLATRTVPSTYIHFRTGRPPSFFLQTVSLLSWTHNLVTEHDFHSTCGAVSACGGGNAMHRRSTAHCGGPRNGTPPHGAVAPRLSPPSPQRASPQGGGSACPRTLARERPLPPPPPPHPFYPLAIGRSSPPPH